MSKYDDAYRALDDEWDRRQVRAYQSATDHTGLWIFGGLLAALIVIVVLCIGIFEFHWWFASHSYSKQDQAIQHSYGNQAGYATVLSQDYQAITADTAKISSDPGNASALAAQRAATINDFCQNVVLTDHPAPVYAAFAQQNCAGGGISLSSAYYTN